MKNIIKIEELLMLFLALYLVYYFNLNFLLYFLLFLIPDLSMVGYLINPKVGAITYNLVHHKAVSILVLILGILFNIQILLFIGLLLFGHSSFDRVFGYGLKFTDDFKNTHLGRI